eukprot:scaffold7320_cov139-Isochrysis_galbana.AAC.2
MDFVHYFSPFDRVGGKGRGILRHAAVISLSSKDSEGTIKLSRSAEGKDVVLQVSTGPRVSGAYSISSIQTLGETEAIPRLQYAKPLGVGAGRQGARPPRSQVSRRILKYDKGTHDQTQAHRGIINQGNPAVDRVMVE